MENRIVNIGDTYGFNNQVNFFIYQISNNYNYQTIIEIIVVSKTQYTKTNKQKRLIFPISLSKGQMKDFYNKSIILIEKKPWR
jgi:hypothetical protein